MIPSSQVCASPAGHYCQDTARTLSGHRLDIAGTLPAHVSRNRSETNKTLPRQDTARTGHRRDAVIHRTPRGHRQETCQETSLGLTKHRQDTARTPPGHCQDTARNTVGAYLLQYLSINRNTSTTHIARTMPEHGEEILGRLPSTAVPGKHHMYTSMVNPIAGQLQQPTT